MILQLRLSEEHSFAGKQKYKRTELKTEIKLFNSNTKEENNVKRTNSSVATPANFFRNFSIPPPFQPSGFWARF